MKQTKYEWVSLYAAVEPGTGASVALQAPHVNTGTMNVFLKMLSDELGERDHAVLILDQAGWHKARALVVPDNITILHLPPCAPELNPVERLWACLRSHYLSSRTYDDYQHLLDAGAEAWQQLTPRAAPNRLRLPLLAAWRKIVIRFRAKWPAASRGRGLRVFGCSLRVRIWIVKSETKLVQMAGLRTV